MYPDPVRVLSIGSSFDELQEDPQAGYKYSVEFCGGTYVTFESCSVGKNPIILVGLHDGLFQGGKMSAPSVSWENTL